MKNRVSPMRAIRNKCVDCTGNQPTEIKACSALDCPLWMYRLGGINPNCGNNAQNPFLQPSNFEELHNLMATDVIKKIDRENAKQTVKPI